MQADPAYAASRHVVQPPNAFIHPDAPGATFPQKKVHRLIDYRSSAIEESRMAQPINFRRKTRSQYATKVWTAEQLKEQEAEEMTKMFDAKLGSKLEAEAKGENENESEKEGEHDSDYEDILESGLDKLQLSAPTRDTKMKTISDKSKAIRKTKNQKKGKRKFKSYKIVNF